MDGDSEKQWMLVFYAVCGAIAGLLIGGIIDLLVVGWMHDGVAFVLFCVICGVIIGIKVGERRVLP